MSEFMPDETPTDVMQAPRMPIMQEIEDLRRRIAAEDAEACDLKGSQDRRDYCRIRATRLTRHLACLLADLAMGKDKAQPTPVPNEHPAIWPLVIADMQGRDQLGRERYGAPLQPFNSRDAMRDWYEEGLDRLAYNRQVTIEWDAIVVERDANKAEIARLTAENEALRMEIEGMHGRQDGSADMW